MAVAMNCDENSTTPVFWFIRKKALPGPHTAEMYMYAIWLVMPLGLSQPLTVPNVCGLKVESGVAPTVITRVSPFHDA